MYFFFFFNSLQSKDIMPLGCKGLLGVIEKEMTSKGTGNPILITKQGINLHYSCSKDSGEWTGEPSFIIWKKNMEREGRLTIRSLTYQLNWSIPTFCALKKRDWFLCFIDYTTKDSKRFLYPNHMRAWNGNDSFWELHPI